MKLLAYLLILIIFLSSVTADLNNDIESCEGNVRCVFRVAAKYEDKEACNNLDSYMVESCNDYVEGVSGLTTAPYSINEFDLGTLIFMVIVLVAIAIIFYYFKEVRPGTKGPVKTLKPYIKRSLKRKERPVDIKARLLKAGWSEEEIKKAFLEVAKK